ncbi:M24 family metallopeptidase [Phycicoccus ginsengisoli]
MGDRPADELVDRVTDAAAAGEVRTDPAAGPGGDDAAQRRDDLRERLDALADVAARAGVDVLVLREPATLAWLLEARVHVPLTLDTACLDAVVDVSGDVPRLTVVTNAIEAPRLQETELANLPVEWAVVPWWESREGRLPRGAGTGSDRPADGTVDVGEAVRALRLTLSSRQQRLLAEVGRDAAAAATRAALALRPGMGEYTAAGVLAAELMADAMDPIVLMVGGGDRGARHRHPLPTARELGPLAMLVCCARRSGVVASVTRIVSFDRLPRTLEDAYGRLLDVEQAFLDASLPGARVGDIVEAGTTAYGRNGFDPLEWHRHHQGGLSGFVPREFPAHQGSDQVLGEGMVVAWNPSAEGVKVEDTAIVTGRGPEPLVHDPKWPTLQVGGRSRPDILRQ